MPSKEPFDQSSRVGLRFRHTRPEEMVIRTRPRESISTTRTRRLMLCQVRYERRPVGAKYLAIQDTIDIRGGQAGPGNAARLADPALDWTLVDETERRIKRLSHIASIQPDRPGIPG